MERNGFVFLKSFYEAISNLPQENQLELYDAICKYSLFGEVGELSAISRAMFILIKPNIDNSTSKYDSNVENGKKGGRPKKTEESKNPTETQVKPNHNPTETQVKPNGNLEKEKDKDKDISCGVSDDTPCASAPDCKRVIELFNAICTSLPRVKELSDGRKRAIKSLLRKHSTEQVESVFKTAAKSDFLSGRTGKWTAGFDWLIKPANFIKVLEGNYDNKAVGDNCAQKPTKFVNYDQPTYSEAEFDAMIKRKREIQRQEGQAVLC